MELIGISLPIMVWVPIFLVAAVLAVVVYTMVVVIGFSLVVGFFFGRDAKSDFEQVTGKPVEVLWDTGNAVRSVFAIPWRLRRKTVFDAVFGFRPEGLFRRTEWDQESVDRKLRGFAIAYNAACNRQERARERYRAQEISIVDMRPDDEAVEETKAAFWTAHNLAEHLGFNVRYAHSEYLPKETPAREGAVA